MLSVYDIANLSVEIAGLSLCALGILLLCVGSRMDAMARRYVFWVFVDLALAIVAHIASIFLSGRTGPEWRAAAAVVYLAVFFANYTLAVLIFFYILDRVDPQRQQRKLWTLMNCVYCLELLLLLVSQFTGLYYTVDEANSLQPGTWYPLSLALLGFVYIFVMNQLVKNRLLLSARERLAFWIYFFVPVIGMLLQVVVKELHLQLFSEIAAAVAMFVFILLDRTETYFRTEKENTDLRVAVMLSQIQPHFLYNSLAVIKEVCHTDPRAAETAIGQFSDYLRHNMDSIAVSRPIPVSQELRHTRCYLDLEQLRFQDALKVETDLESTDFMVPTLTLQPLVENAVRHGVRKNPGGRGTVRIVTRELEDRYEVIVSDDGPGFDTAKLADPGGQRSHLGIRNTRDRIRRLSGGELTIESAPGAGTVATISIPKTRSAARGAGRRTGI